MSLRDSTRATNIPLEGLTAVAGYGDGIYEWSSDDWARFQPPIVPLVIVVSAAHVGDVLDVENGDATPADCPGWADRFSRPARRRPTIYCNRDTIASVRQAMGARPFDWWASTLDGTQQVAGAVAVQYVDVNGLWDESVIIDLSWIGEAMGIANAASDGDLVALHHFAQFFCFGPVDPSGQEAFVAALRAGTPMNAIIDGWTTLPQSQAWLAAVRNLVADDQRLAHLQAAGAGVDPAALQQANAQLAADMGKVLADLQAAAANPAL